MSTKPKKKPGPKGPRLKLTPAQLKKIGDHAKAQCKDHTIAHVMGIQEDTFKKNCAEFTHQKRAEGKAEILAAQFKGAKKQIPSLAIWWGKQHIGQRDTPPVDDIRIDAGVKPSALAMIMEGTMRGVAPTDGILPSAWSTYHWTPSQMRLLQSSARFLLLACGRGSGKTDMGLRRLVIRLAEHKEWDDPRYFFIAPTNQQAMRIGWDRIGKLIPSDWIEGEPHRSEQYYETKFGSRLYVLGMDKPHRFEGLQWDGGIIDESSDQRPGVFDLNVLPALTHRKGWCWRSGVPKRTGMGATEFRAACEGAAKEEIVDTEAHSWHSSEVLSEETIESARARLDARDFREQFEASWETAGGAIFWSFNESMNKRPCSYQPDKTLAIACDFNVDPMAWCIGHRYHDRMEWFDEVFIRNTNTRSCMDVLWNRYSDHDGGFEFFGDAASRQRHTSASFSDYATIYNDDRFKNSKGGRKVYILESNPARSDRFAACNALFCNAAGDRRMFVDPNCKNLIDDILSRKCAPGKSDPDDKGDSGHMTDAMGYLVWCCWPIQIELDTAVPTVIVSRGR